MNAYQRMCTQLKTTGLYRLDNTTIVEAEMKAYADVMSQLQEQLQEILKNGFFDIVNGTMTEKFDILFGLPVHSDPNVPESEGERKDKIKLMKRRLAVRNTDFYLQAMKDQLELGGIKANLTESPENREVQVTILEDQNYFLQNSEKQAFIQSILPCHVKAVVTFLE